MVRVTLKNRRFGWAERKHEREARERELSSSHSALRGYKPPALQATVEPRFNEVFGVLNDAILRPRNRKTYGEESRLTKPRYGEQILSVP